MFISHLSHFLLYAAGQTTLCTTALTTVVLLVSTQIRNSSNQQKHREANDNERMHTNARVCQTRSHRHTHTVVQILSFIQFTLDSSTKASQGVLI